MGRNRFHQKRSRRSPSLSSTTSGSSYTTSTTSYEHDSRRRRHEREKKRRTSQRPDPLDRFNKAMSNFLSNASVKAGPVYRGDAIPIFDPEDNSQTVASWCAKVDELSEIHKWSETTTAYYAMTKLRGLAEIWYKGLPTIKDSWAKWKVMLQSAFPCTRDYYSMLEQMMARRKRSNESYAKYFYEKQALLTQCRIIKSDAVSCIIGGIDNEHIRNCARAGNYQDPESLFGYLRTITEGISEDTASGSGGDVDIMLSPGESLSESDKGSPGGGT